MRLDKKVAIVTGSTKGIGKGIATTFAAEGAGVVVTGRSEAAGESVVDEIKGRGGRAAFVKADVSVESDVQRLIESTVDEFGQLDVIVNNAAATDLVGGGGDRPVTELETSSLEQIIRVSLFGPLWMCKYGIPHMVRAGGGSVVNISSYSSVFGLKGIPSYSASKGALNALTRQVAVDYGSQNIRSNAIIIGFVASGEMSALFAEHPVVGKAFEEATLTRSGTPTDIALAAVYLASAESAFITGVCLPADGGLATRSSAPDFSSLLG